MPQILLIGGSGYVGQHLLHELVQSYQVIMPTRRKDITSAMSNHPEVKLIQVKEYSSDQIDRLMSYLGGQDVVINLAGILHDRQGQPYGPGFKETHVDLPKRLIAAMNKQGIKRYIHMSALGASSSGPSMYLRSKGDAEQFINTSNLDFTIFRPSVIFGSDDKFINLFGDIQKYAPFVPLAGASVLFQPVSVDDVAKIFTQSISDSKTIKHTYDLAGPKVYTFSEIVKFAGQRRKVSRSILPLPAWLGYIQALMMELMPGIPLMSRDNLDSMKIDNILSPNAPQVIETEFGIIPTPLESLLN